MQIRKQTVFTAELTLTEIELISDGLHGIRSRYEGVNESAIRIIDNMIKDFELIRENSVTEIKHNA